MLRHADDVKGQAASGSNREGESTETRRRGGAARSSVEGPVMGLEPKGLRCSALATGQLETGGARGRGKAVQATAEHREPCDSRGSCTVLGAPGGEIPPGDSTTAEILRPSGSVSSTSESRLSAGSLNRPPQCQFRKSRGTHCGSAATSNHASHSIISSSRQCEP